MASVAPPTGGLTRSGPDRHGTEHGRPLVVTGIIGGCVAAAAAGLAVLTLLVLVGWIAAPHAGLGLTGVLRTAAMLWLIGHHVGFRCTAPGGSACCRWAWSCCPARCCGGRAGGWCGPAG